jgi:tRNA(Ile)-lysidine synthase
VKHGPPLLLGVSGGRDSVVLLHFFRFHHPGRPPLRVLHVDHALRPGSGDDAAWVRGLCRAWGVPCRVVRLDPPPVGEGPSREARYRALEEEARRIGARRILLAHHAGDQAETVLFRLLRGTGPRGLAGIPPARPVGEDASRSGRRLGGEPPGASRGHPTDGSLPPPATRLQVDRPLLGVPGPVLEAWARDHRLSWREDPTNREPGPARNRIRHHLLPRLEAASPGFRSTLLALARASRRREEALAEVLAPALASLCRRAEEAGRAARTSLSAGGNRLLVARDPLLAYPPALRRELLRAMGRELGVRLGQRGLGLLEAFAVQGESGRGVTPAPGLRVTRDFQHFVFQAMNPPSRRADREAPPPPPLMLGHPDEVSGVEGWGGRWSLRWGPLQQVAPSPRSVGEAGVGGARGWEWRRFHREALAFPLVLRSREPGDRLAPGGRRLKKLLGSERVSREDRDRLPLVVDRHGLVIWVAGLWHWNVPDPAPPNGTWTLGVLDARDPR